MRQALDLLEKAFGSRDVEFRELLRQVLEGPGVKREHRALLKLYIALQGCWIAAESSDSLEELNSNATVDALFRRLPLELRKDLHSRAVKHNLGDRIPYEFVMSFVLEKAEAANSRWGRLLQEPTQSRAAASSKPRPVRLNLMQSENTATEAKSEGNYLDNSSRRARTCICCASKDHLLHRCNIFLRKSVGQRRGLVRDKQACFVCFGLNHRAAKCFSKKRCASCGAAHHSLLHFEKTDTDPASQEAVSEGGATTTTTTDTMAVACTEALPSASGKSFKRLQVLPVCVSNRETNESRQTLCLLDVGADTHVMTRSLAESIGLGGKPIVSVTQFADGSTSGWKVTQRVACQVRGVKEAESYGLEDVLIVENIADLKSRSPQPSDLRSSEHLRGVEIPEIETSEVELIVGGVDPQFHIQYEVREGSFFSLWAVKTLLGWTLLGQSRATADAQLSRDDQCHLHLLVANELQSALEHMCSRGPEWADLDADPDLLLPSLDDERATEVMERTCALVEGHQQIGLPFKPGCPDLPDSEAMARSRLMGLKRRFLRNPEVFVQYKTKVDEMVEQGHAVELPSDQSLAEKGRVWHIPHHFVMNPKFRMVFDCAAEVGGQSLNGQILQGPDNTNTLLGVLFRFRLHDVALVGDIRTMFHQVRVDLADRSVLRFLWWKDGDLTGPILTYQLNVHCFGLTSSPSVCGFALRRTARENRTNASEMTLSTVNRNFYVDDMLASFPSADACIQLVPELDDLLRSGGFEMAKYASNNVDVINAIPKERLASSLQMVEVGSDVLPSHKVLGLA